MTNKYYLYSVPILLLLPLLLVPRYAYAADFGQSPTLDNECGFGLDKSALKQLNLTDKQKGQIANLELLNKNATTEALMRRGKVRQAFRMEMQKILLADHLDDIAASELTHNMANSQAYLNLRLIEQQHAILNVLTSKQKALYVQIENKKASQCRS
ncbi:Spy/CpxP family protein refolding chaperone [Vibrio sp. S4M6]|uniref:Spy/CpxP family protein refolding chaperone n=1 Tax=Vibrio sinus TaxID=2946865 RepID=UPI00202AA156|nr:Spy/CpxP family protein refolding chaperone [Vibrio sinus]MCL9783528.1 Spy/CpxP family protein refolding chaperone [Vibrio sinus]